MNRMPIPQMNARCEEAKWWATADDAPAMNRDDLARFYRSIRREMHRAEMRRNDPGPQKELPNV